MQEKVGFIKTTSVADKMVQLNKTINWAPPEVGAGRFGNWLEDNKIGLFQEIDFGLLHYQFG